jgi:hypothetical protein
LSDAFKVAPDFNGRELLRAIQKDFPFVTLKTRMQKEDKLNGKMIKTYYCIPRLRWLDVMEANGKLIAEYGYLVKQ